MHDVHIYRRATAHQIYFTDCFMEGLRKHGVPYEVRSLDRIEPCKTAVLWSARDVDRLKCENYLLMERGYVGGRVKFTSIGWNGLNGRADFCNMHSPSDRKTKHGIDYMPWRLGGKYILIMGQVHGDASLRNTDIDAWYTGMIAGIRTITERPIAFRPHPLSRQNRNYPGVKTMTGTLEEALDQAYVCVTFNSNSGVDAVMHGVPTIAMDRGSMVWPVAMHNPMVGLHHRLMPDREQWLNNLMYCQWTVDEIKGGEAWEHLSRDN